MKHEGEEGKRTETKAAIVKYQETKLEAPKRAFLPQKIRRNLRVLRGG